MPSGLICMDVGQKFFSRCDGVVKVVRGVERHGEQDQGLACCVAVAPTTNNFNNVNSTISV